LGNGAKSTEVTLSLQLKVLQDKIDTLEQEKKATEIVVDDLKNQIKPEESNQGYEGNYYVLSRM
jgi:uncharacterized protein (UPF0335 family)